MKPRSLCFTAFLAAALTSCGSPDFCQFDNYTTADGLASSNVTSVFVDGSTIYAGTDAGLSVSTDGAASWRTFTEADGLLARNVVDVYADGGSAYVLTTDGLSISSDGGATWVARGIAEGIWSSQFEAVAAKEPLICIASFDGLFISADGGATWSLHAGWFNDVCISEGVIYATTTTGLLTSIDNGDNFTPYPGATGWGVFAINGSLLVGKYTGLYVYTNGYSHCSVSIPYSCPPFRYNHYIDIYSIHASSTSAAVVSDRGLAISQGSYTNFGVFDVLDGLGGDPREAFVSGTTVYVATTGGLSISRF